MLSCNVNSGYNYGGYLESALYAAGWDAADVNKVKLWNSGCVTDNGDADVDDVTWTAVYC